MANRSILSGTYWKAAGAIALLALTAFSVAGCGNKSDQELNAVPPTGANAQTASPAPEQKKAQPAAAPGDAVAK